EAVDIKYSNGCRMPPGSTSTLTSGLRSSWQPRLWDWHGISKQTHGQHRERHHRYGSRVRELQIVTVSLEIGLWPTDPGRHTDYGALNGLQPEVVELAQASF